MSSIPDNHRERIACHVKELNRRLGFGFTSSDLDHLIAQAPQLGERATESVVTNVAGLMRLLKLSSSKLQPFLLTVPTFLCRSSTSVQTQFTDNAAVLGLPWRSYVKKVLKNPRIANATPDGVNLLVETLAGELHVERKAAIAMIRRHILLLGSSPETLASNIREAIALLQLQKPIYVKIVKRSPSLMATPATTLLVKVNAFAELFETSPSTAMTVMRRAPQLLAMSPDTIRSNIQASSAALSIRTDTWKKMVLKRPGLAGYRADTLFATVTKMSTQLNMPASEVIAVAERYPAILLLSIAGIRSKLPLVLDVCHALGFRYAASDALRECPLAFTYAPNRLQERLLLAKCGLGPRSIMNLLSLANVDAAPLLRRVPSIT